VIARRLPDRTVLLHGTSGACFELNATGTAVWEQLDGRRSWAQIADELARRFAVAAATARTDVDGVARRLADAGLVEPADANLG
jgi:hypothetical protein